MILITISCCVFIITLAVPINAEFVDVQYTSAYRYLQLLGYIPATSTVSGNSSGSLNLTVPAQGTSFEIRGDGTMFPNSPGGWVVGWHGTAATQPFYPSGTFNFSQSFTEGLSLPVLARSGEYNTTTSLPNINIKTSRSSSGTFTDAFVISFICDNDVYPAFSYSGGMAQTWYDNYSGNMTIFTILVYDPACSNGSTTKKSGLSIYFDKRPSFVLPIYFGQLSDMTDDMKIISNLRVFTTDIQILNAIQSINDSIVNGTSESQTVSDALKGSSISAATSIGNLEGYESDMIGNFNSNLIHPDTSFISQLSTSANWVRNVFDSIIGIHPAFSGVLVVGLTIALALVIIGKMRG